MKPWITKSVRELQLHLKDRGVTYANELKASLVQLCSDAESMGLEIDPDGLHEDSRNINKEVANRRYPAAMPNLADKLYGQHCNHTTTQHM